MSPERRRWCDFIAMAHADVAAIADRGLMRLGGHDACVLTLDERRDVGSVIAMAEHAAVLCARLIASLSDEDEDEDEDEEGAAP